MLRRACYDPNAVNEDGDTALHGAARRERADLDRSVSGGPRHQHECEEHDPVRLALEGLGTDDSVLG